MLASVLLLGCAEGVDGDGRGCEAEARGQMVAFLEQDAPPLSARFSGTVVSVAPGSGPDAYRYVIRDAAGAERRLAYRAPDGPLPVKEGAAYEFQVDYVGGAPAASGLLIRDRTGLVFAGATDQGLGAHVLKDGLPGLTLELRPPACPGRAAGTCFESITNRPLRVTHEGRPADLLQGQSVRLGPYRVTCLAAQSVVYRSGCADAGRPGVSYLIARVD
jgi:hypothetical protein